MSQDMCYVYLLLTAGERLKDTLFATIKVTDASLTTEAQLLFARISTI